MAFHRPHPEQQDAPDRRALRLGAHGGARKIAQRLSEQRPAGLAPLQICLQVNISGEASKSGVAPEELSALAHKVAALPNLTLRGLMAIPEPVEDFAQQRAAFAALRALYEQLRAEGLALDTLSMGMSADLRAAIVEGATIVRVGSAIFGAKLSQGLRHENSIYRRRQYGLGPDRGLANKLTDGAQHPCGRPECGSAGAPAAAVRRDHGAAGRCRRRCGRRDRAGRQAASHARRRSPAAAAHRCRPSAADRIDCGRHPRR
jgi:hypothetical protein